MVKIRTRGIWLPHSGLDFHILKVRCVGTDLLIISLIKCNPKNVFDKLKLGA